MTFILVGICFQLFRVQYAGGLFSSGTGLEQNFLKEVSTSLFVATEMAMSSINQIGAEDGHEASTAAKAVVLASMLISFILLGSFQSPRGIENALSSFLIYLLKSMIVSTTKP